MEKKKSKPEPRKESSKKKQAREGFAAMAAMANRPKGKKKG